MRTVQCDFGFKQRQRQIIEQGRPIQRIHFDHCKPVGRLIINQHRWRNFKGVGPAERFWFCIQLSHQARAVGERIFNVALEPI